MLKNLLNSDNNLKFFISSIEKNGVLGYYKKSSSEICINEILLSRNPDSLDSVICHEFIHFLVMHELDKNKHNSQIVRGGFLNEALTELLTQEMYPKSNSYEAQVTMQNFTNLISNNGNNFKLFLQGYIDSSYASHSWNHYLTHVNNFQNDFDDKDYIDFIKKLNKRSVLDEEYINTKILPNLDRNFIHKLNITNPEIQNSIKDKLENLRTLLNQLDTVTNNYTFNVGGEPFELDENFKIKNHKVGLQTTWNPNNGIIKCKYNNEEVTINTNDINFHEKEETIVGEINSIKTVLSQNLNSDLAMLSQINQENPLKIEKHQVINLTTSKGNRPSIYIAYYPNKVAIINDLTPLGLASNIKSNIYIGRTSSDIKKSLIYQDELGQFQMV